MHLATELCGTWIARNSHGLSIDYHPDVISVSGGRLFKHSRYMIRRHGWWLLHVGGLLASIILEPPYDMSERYRYTTLSAVSSLFWTTAEHSAKIGVIVLSQTFLISVQTILNVVQFMLNNFTLLGSSILLAAHLQGGKIYNSWSNMVL